LLSYPKIDDHAEIRQQREEYISLADEIVLVDEKIARKAAEEASSGCERDGVKGITHGLYVLGKRYEAATAFLEIRRCSYRETLFYSFR
jgi:hypothetical protein